MRSVLEKSLIVLSLFQYKYWSEYRAVDLSGSGRELNHWTSLRVRGKVGWITVCQYDTCHGVKWSRGRGWQVWYN